MNINDVNPWTALGLEEPEQDPAAGAPEGENEPAVAEPEGEGGNDPGRAEPDTDDDMDPETGEEPEQDPEPAQKQTKEPMSKEERAANARRRRQKEIDDAVAAARAEEQKKFNDRLSAFFKDARMKNAHNGNSDILTLEDAEAWAEADRLAKAEAALKAGKLTPEVMQTLVEESPGFKAMQQKLRQQEQVSQNQSQQQFQKSVETELAEIRKLNPQISGLTDILNMDTGKQFAAYVQKHGMSYLDAYKLANHEQLMQQAQQVAAAGARVAAGGKDHLKKTQSRGQGALEVPADVKENYRVLMPGMTDEEIQKEYNRFMKGK